MGAADKFAGFLVLGVLGQAHIDARVELDFARIKSPLHLADIRKNQPLALAVGALAGGVVQTQHHVLRRHDGGLAIRREQHVVGSQHQGAAFHLGFNRQGHMDGHLVAVKVGIECCADQWVQLDCFAFNQDRLEGLDAQAVQRGGAVEHDRVLFDHLFEDVPNHRRAGLHLFFSRLDGGGYAHGFQTGKDEGLEQLQRHQFRQPALVQFECWPDHNHRATRVIDPFAQQVLAETPALAFNHVCQGLERALVGAGHGLAAATVVKQGVDRFLQHAFFVAGDDLGRLELEQTAQSAVAVDHAAVQVIEV